MLKKILVCNIIWIEEPQADVSVGLDKMGKVLGDKFNH
jgi:hypothetical protein